MENELLQSAITTFQDGSIGAPMLRSQVAGYRAIWISDLHLGTRRCRARALLDFLCNHYAETLYLVGDIVDGWNSGRSWYWDKTQAAVVDQIRFWQGLGSRVVFLPGNHDEFSSSLVDSMFRPDSIHDQLVHVTAEGRRMLTLHGHQFHPMLNPTRLLSMMGSET